MEISFSFVYCSNRVDHLQAFWPGLTRLVSKFASSSEFVVVAPIGATQNWSLLFQSEIAQLKLSRCNVVFLESAWGNRNTQRNDGMARAQGEWVYFLDSDVRFPKSSDLASRLEEILRQEKTTALFTGPYENAPRSSYWQNAYNWLANLWLNGSVTGERALAGNVLLNRRLLTQRAVKLARQPFATDLPTGGEEIDLVHRLRYHRLTCKIDLQLKVIHETETGLPHLWRRLREHERARTRLPRLSRASKQPITLRMELLSTPRFWPVIALVTLAKIPTTPYRVARRWICRWSVNVSS